MDEVRNKKEYDKCINMKYLKLFEDFDNHNNYHVWFTAAISKSIKELKYNLEKTDDEIIDCLTRNGIKRPMAVEVYRFIAQTYRKFDPTKLDNYVDGIINYIDDKYENINKKPEIIFSKNW
jgi:hypothetical protein